MDQIRISNHEKSLKEVKKLLAKNSKQCHLLLKKLCSRNKKKPGPMLNI